MGLMKLDNAIREIVSEAVLTDEIVRVPLQAKRLAGAHPEAGMDEHEIAERLMEAAVSARVPMEIVGSQNGEAEPVREKACEGV